MPCGLLRLCGLPVGMSHNWASCALGQVAAGCSLPVLFALCGRCPDLPIHTWSGYIWVRTNNQSGCHYKERMQKFKPWNNVFLATCYCGLVLIMMEFISKDFILHRHTHKHKHTQMFSPFSVFSNTPRYILFCLYVLNTARPQCKFGWKW
jgi:hypothetical protein